MFQFDPQDCPPGLINYWGYSPVSFFAPHAGYSSRRDPLGPVDEFRDLVKALHRAGIEVILDVVYNHTAEGNDDGPTLCFRGLDNETYYLLQPDRARYADYTGTGNTLNANEAVVRRLILDSLRYWVGHMHVDGFRFDLASVLSRDESGCPLQRPPILWDIESDPVLAGTKLIAEAWDAAGLYQVGSFGGDAWQEWNGKFRDDVRRFVKSDNETVLAFGHRCFGSPDLYAHKDRGPEQSINFITSHDGFTLNDLVSYNAKHNEANGEGGRDGSDANLSWNCGSKGRAPIRDRAAAPSPGEELPGHHAALAGHADAADGRRGPADAAWQQQCLLPGQRDQLVRLDAPRPTPGSPPLREDAGRPAPHARERARHRRRELERTVAAGGDPRARRPVERARSGAPTRTASPSRCGTSAAR